MSEKDRKMSLEITVDDGSRRVPIKNTLGEELGFFIFHPTDFGILERYNTMVGEFDRVTEPLEKLGENATAEQVIEARKEANTRLYTAVDALFNAKNSADSFFGKADPFSPIEGRFYCEEVLKAVGQYISDQFDIETKKFEARTKKYTDMKRPQRVSAK